MTVVTVPIGAKLLAMDRDEMQLLVAGEIQERLHIELMREQEERERVFLYGNSATMVITDEATAHGIIDSFMRDIAKKLVEDAVLYVREKDAQRKRIPGLDHSGKGGKRKNKWSRWHG